MDVCEFLDRVIHERVWLGGYANTGNGACALAALLHDDQLFDYAPTFLFHHRILRYSI